jgi:threonine/homoserine/homoserine lactone efflux protein
MISVDHLLGFAVASFILIVIPGPSVLFVIGRALAYGRRTALATVVGNAVGVYLVAAAVAFGLGPAVERSALLFMIVKLAGAGYLVWLGFQAIHRRRTLKATFAAVAEPLDARRAAREGFIVGFANPKAVILFAAVLPQFVDRSAGHVPVQMLVLSLISFVNALVTDSAWGIAAGAVRSWFARSPRRLELVGGTGGLMMIGLGVTVAATGRKD